MAKLKEKIKELQTQYGITEDAAKAVLALHEGDLQESQEMLTEEQKKVVKWNQWYTENSPAIAASLQELETLRSQVQALEKAGFKPQPPAPNPANPANPNTPTNLDEILDQRESRIYNNFSQVQKDLYNIQRYHMQHYKELPDIDPIEKLITEKKMSPWAAYQEWVAPMDKERTTKELRETITKELTEKFQNEATRSGVNGYLLKSHSATTGEEVTSPLDEVVREQAEKAAAAAKPGNTSNAPNDLELMADFVGTMKQGRAGNLAH